ncbi:ExeM/NucH family extracellular endonuclease [Pararhizobium haloflavum]|uniref:ExeM/NucH family extracellular endonuclease n=1 Tax=Pararhizobium haloflavum TaxID=2037914 RepID=UPI0013001657|nr:ExeM/NucH family extracellular endonuclease [Pararhizobium haloflavum]
MPTVFISELHYDNDGTDTGEAIEITGPAGTDLTGWSIVLYNGSSNSAYSTRTLSGILPDQGDGLGTSVLTYPSNGIQNGAPDGIALVDAEGSVVEFLSYEGTMTAADGPAAGLTSTDIGVSQTGSEQAGSSLQRSLDQTSWAATESENSFGTLNGAPADPSDPGDPGDGGLDVSDIRINEFHYDNADTDAGEAIEVRVNADADLTGWSIALYRDTGTVYDTIDLSGADASDSGDGFAYVVAEASGLQNGPADGFALVGPDGTVVEFLSYEGTLTATEGPAAGTTSTDVGAEETSSAPIGSSIERGADGAWTFSSGTNTFGAANGTDGGGGDGGQDGEPAPLLISEIQGSGSASFYQGDYVLAEAVVTYTVGNGFFMQEEMNDYDGDAATSEGIFVFTGGAPQVAVGDLVGVSGTVTEFNGLTELTDVDITVNSAGNDLPDYTEITLPRASADIFEAVEGMRTSLTSSSEAPITVVENFNLARYGEVVLSAGTQIQPTQIYDAQTQADEIDALQAENALNRLTIDDGVSSQNPTEFSYIPVEDTYDANGNGYLDAEDTFTADGPTLRLGAEMDSAVEGVMTYQFGDYAMLVDGTLPVDQDTNTGARQDTPADVGGNAKVASFNVLNYFTTLGERGATTTEDLERQTTKIVDAMLEIDADVLGVQEIENNGFGEGSAMAALVDALNDEAAVRGLAADYRFVDPTNGGDGIIGTDQITTGVIYNAANVTLGGSDYLVFDDGGEQLNRPAVAATFTDIETDETFSIAVNHFKSKGGNGESGSGNEDTGDGQGAWNAARTEAANQLAEWIASDPTGSGDSDYLVLGDLNAYAKEDPVQALRAAGYADLIDQFIGQENAYSYVFDGQRGTLDQALATGSMAEQVSGVTEWHINADEPGLLGYSSEFNDPRFYNEDVFAASDHDPVVIGLDLGGDDADPAAGFELARLNDWYNPAWGGGYNASFTYTVQEQDLIDGSVSAWEILPNYSGDGAITNAWVTGYGGATSRGENADGDFVITTKDQGYKPELVAGDTIDFSIQVQGAAFDDDDFAFDFNDIDRMPSGDDPLMAEIDAGSTNDWGSGFGQNVSVINLAEATIDDWAVELDVPEGVTIDVTSVWGATVTNDADGDLIFMAADWNATIGKGGQAQFGFNGTYAGSDTIAFEDGDFSFYPGIGAMQDEPLAA